MNATASPKPSSTRRGVLIGLAIGLGGALALVLVALLVFGVPGGAASSDRDITIDDEHVAVKLTVPGDLAIDWVSSNPDAGTDCRRVRYEFVRDLVIEAVATDCAVGAEQEIMNGGHGVYRTLEDVPDPVEVDEVGTGAGTAQVFVQRYEEYTNESNAWDEPVAIVTLDDPADAAFPTLVLRSDRAALSREEFTEIVASLSSLDHR